MLGRRKTRWIKYPLADDRADPPLLRDVAEPVDAATFLAGSDECVISLDLYCPRMRLPVW
jgi:hypothetical protein